MFFTMRGKGMLAMGGTMILAGIVFFVKGLFTYDEDGYNNLGYDNEGYNRKGYKHGYDRDGYDKRGFDRKGYNREGYTINGYNKKGFNKEGYDRKGFDIYGYNRNGYDKAQYTKQEKDEFLQKLKKDINKSALEFEKNEHDDLPNRSRKQIEGILKYILKINERFNFEYSDPHLIDLIECVKEHKLLPEKMIEKLLKARNFCNTGSHFQAKSKLTKNQTFYILKTVEELIMYWEEHYYSF